MRKALSVIFACLVVLSAFAQNPAKYQVGTITAITPHKATAGADSSGTRYDVSVKVGDTVYVVLFTEPADSYGAKY
jgi:co-chaperonin GroES (HSP10)